MTANKQFLFPFMIILLFLFINPKVSQGQGLKLLHWQPISQMVTKETKIIKPRYPVIDIHNYLRDLKKTAHYLEEMDKAGVWICIDLDGLSKDDFYKKNRTENLQKPRFGIQRQIGCVYLCG